MSNDPRLNQFLKRLPEGAHELRQYVTSAFDVLANYKSKAESVRTDKKLTAEGKDFELSKLVSGSINERLNKIAKEIEGPLLSIKSERIGLRKEVAKEENFSEARKQEVRAWLRSLDPPERYRMALNADDALMAEAVTTAPAYLSSLTPEIHDKVVDSVVAQKFAERISHLDWHESALSSASTAIDVIKSEIDRDMSYGKKFAA